MNRSARLRQFQRLLAPGTPLREGLDRVLHGRTGALVVLGNNSRVQQVTSGGFTLDVDYTPQSLRELAKMDGAIILSNDLGTIVAAGVQLMPPAHLPTAERGTRHRSADRVAQFTGVPTVTVSASMSTISLFMDGHRYVVESAERLVSRANQTLTTLNSFVVRLTDLLAHFDALELAHHVTIRDLTQVCHRFEMTRRLSAETQFHIDLLGAEGRHVELQHAEMITPLLGLKEQLTTDYAHNVTKPSEFDLALLQNFSTEELLNSSLVAERLGFGHRVSLETSIRPKGLRLLANIGRLPANLISKLIEEHSLRDLMEASTESLTAIEGIGPHRARTIQDALARISEVADVGNA